MAFSWPGDLCSLPFPLLLSFFHCFTLPVGLPWIPYAALPVFIGPNLSPVLLVTLSNCLNLLSSFALTVDWSFFFFYPVFFPAFLISWDSSSLFFFFFFNLFFFLISTLFYYFCLHLRLRKAVSWVLARTCRNSGVVWERIFYSIASSE